MKKYLFFLLLTGFVFAQQKPITTYQTTYFYADSISQVLSLDKGFYLKGMLIPEGLTKTVEFQVSNDNSHYYALSDTGGVLLYNIDSSKALALPLVDKFTGWKYYKFLKDKKTTDTTSVISVLSNK